MGAGVYVHVPPAPDETDMLFLILTSLMTPAMAQEDECNTVRRGVQSVCFDEIDVTGTLDGPTIGVGFEERRRGFTSFIVLRKNFDVEIERGTREF